MDCPNCQFINMPGLRTCASCGGRLVFDNVDVVPPRARDAILPAPVRTSFHRARLSVRDEVRLSTARIKEVINSAAPPAAIVASLFPGGGHFLLRQGRAGTIYFLLWFAGALGVVYMLGTEHVLLPYGFMVGIHCLSISQLLSRRLADLSIPQRLLIGFLISVAVNVIIYAPLYRILSTLVVSIELRGIAAGPTFLSGDVIWVEGPSLRQPLRRGDIVVRTIRQPRQDSPYGMVVHSGIVADRIIGIPGDNVTFDGQLITVNGEALTPGRYPVAPVTLTKNEYLLDKDEFIVVPSTVMITGQTHLAAPILSQLSLTRRQEILGRVVFRIQPLDRMEIFPRSKDISPPPRDPDTLPTPVSTPTEPHL